MKTIRRAVATGLLIAPAGTILTAAGIYGLGMTWGGLIGGLATAVVGTLGAYLALNGVNAQSAARAVPAFNRVVVVVMENKGRSEVLGNRAAPAFNAFAVASCWTTWRPVRTSTDASCWVSGARCNNHDTADNASSAAQH